VEGGNILVKIDREKIEASGTSLDGRLVLLEDIVEVIGRLCRNRSDLLVAASIAGDEEDRNTLDL